MSVRAFNNRNPIAESAKKRQSIRTKTIFIAAIAVVAGLVGTTTTASAATPQISSVASVTVSGTTATATTTVTTGASTPTGNVGVCVRDANWKNADFPLSGAVTLSASPTVVTKSRTYAPGIYYYWTCAQINGTWNTASGYQSFQVFDGTPAVTGIASIAVSGTSVMATASVTTEKSTLTQYVGVCVRDSAGRGADFDKTSGLTLSKTPTYVAKSKSFEPGIYTYWPCVSINGVWNSTSNYQTFQVLAQPGAGDGVSMPVGNLPGWTQIFSDDFTTPVASGGFPGPYASKWSSYDGFPDTSGAGWNDKSILSVHDGYLDANVQTRDGKVLVTAPTPLLNGQWGGQVYGRYSMRMKAPSVQGFGIAALLWPDSNNWNDGEVDFPESALSENAKGYVHCVGNPSVNCLWFDSGFTYADWHTYTIDWKPGSLTFLVDGNVVSTNTSSVPTKAMHWILQLESRGTTAAQAFNGHVLFDWATIYKYTP